MLLYDQKIIGASSEIFGDLRKSSEIFGKSPKNVRKRSPHPRNNFGKSSEIFGKRSEILGKTSKTSSLVCICNKQSITCPLVDMNFIFSCSCYLPGGRSVWEKTVPEVLSTGRTLDQGHSFFPYGPT